MKNKTRKTIISWINQLLIFIAIFYAITWWQQKDMLDTSSNQFSPIISLVDMKGQVHHFDPKQQTKKTLLYFFAPWCSICHASIDNIESIKSSFGDEINFYAVALDWKNKEEVEEFLSQHDLSIAVLLGTSKTLEDFKIGGFPSYYVVDKDGLLKSKDMGYTTELGMRARLGIAEL